MGVSEGSKRDPMGGAGDSIPEAKIKGLGSKHPAPRDRTERRRPGDVRLRGGLNEQKLSGDTAAGHSQGVALVWSSLALGCAINQRR